MEATQRSTAPLVAPPCRTRSTASPNEGAQQAATAKRGTALQAQHAAGHSTARLGTAQQGSMPHQVDGVAKHPGAQQAARALGVLGCTGEALEQGVGPPCHVVPMMQAQRVGMSEAGREAGGK